jgi:hypothetical protein
MVTRPSRSSGNVPPRRPEDLTASLQFPSDFLVFSCYNAPAVLQRSEEGGDALRVR